MKTYEGKYSSIILDPGSMLRWMVSLTPQLLYPRGIAPGTHWIGGWVGTRGGWMLCRREESYPCRLSHRQSLCRLRYPVSNNALQSGESEPTFHRDVSPSSWGSKNKPSKKPTLFAACFTAVEWAPGTLSVGVKWTRCEADQSRSEFKGPWSFSRHSR
jgi:hypothetical protein